MVSCSNVPNRWLVVTIWWLSCNSDSSLPRFNFLGSLEPFANNGNPPLRLSSFASQLEPSVIYARAGAFPLIPDIAVTGHKFPAAIAVARRLLGTMILH